MNIHTERFNFALSPSLKESVSVAAHSNLMSTAEYIRQLIIDDLMKNSEITEEGIFYTVKNKIFDV